MDPKPLNEASERISKILNRNTMYQNAPELLMEQMLELAQILTNYKAKNGENDTAKKFQQILNAMRHSWNFMNDIAFVYTQNTGLQSKLEITEELLNATYRELSKYKAIEASFLDGSLEKNIEVIKKINQ